MFKHLRETGLTYLAHQKRALHYSVRLQKCAIKVFIHSVWPDLYPRDASDEISRLHKEIHGENKTKNT